MTDQYIYEYVHICLKGVILNISKVADISFQNIGLALEYLDM